MAKFIIEVSDDFIREQAGMEKMMDKMKSSEGGIDAVAMIAEFFAFKHIKDALDKGETEFTYTADNMDDGKGLEIFNKIVSRVATLQIIKEKTEMEKQQ